MKPPRVFSTTDWHLLEDNRVQCDVCPRYCKLREGQRGLCYVRGCENHQVVLHSYGRSSGFCVDPIEKKPLNQFLPGSSVLSFGTAGCNLACKFCQNWDMSKSREMDTLSATAMPQQIADKAFALGCRSVAYTYNDPVIFLEYAIDTAQACHEQGINSVAVSAGYICDAPRERFFQHMDAVNIDLKAFTEHFYKHFCGGELAVVLDTLRYLKTRTNVWLEVTTLLIPGENDSDSELHAMTQWFKENLGADVPLHFSAFHPDWKMRNIARTPLSTLTRARRIAIENGLSYVYTGNACDPQGESTYCPGCGELLIARQRYLVSEWNLSARNSCLACGHGVAGVFEGVADTCR